MYAYWFRLSTVTGTRPMVSVLTFLLLSLPAVASDWPAWGYDHYRSASSPHQLSESLHLQWRRQLPEPAPAWPRQMDDFEKLSFDRSYAPVAAGGLLFVASMVTDSVTAYELESGREKWRYFTDGPVRMAPLFWQGRLYVAADDGVLHCLDAVSGEPVWRFRAAPNNRLVLGNERIISLWPLRGGPVIKDGIIYFAAGLWPHEGVFIYALDAETAAVKWVNSGAPSDLILDSKQYYSFGGVSPQGQLAVKGDRLLVPGGRTVPAVFDRHTGAQLYYNVATDTTGKGAGGHQVLVRGDWLVNVRDHRVAHLYSVIDGAPFGTVNIDLADAEAFIGVNPEDGRVTAYAVELALRDPAPPEPEFDRRGQPLDASSRGVRRRDGRLRRGALGNYYELDQLWRSEPVDGLRRLHLRAGTLLYGSGDNGRVYAVTASEDRPAEVVWQTSVEGEVFSMIAADRRLVVTTEEGWVYCFGPDEVTAGEFRLSGAEPATDSTEWAAMAARILAEVDPRGGYALMFGAGSGRLLDELLEQSDLHVTVFDHDAGTVDRLRRRLTRTGLYGRRAAVHQGGPNDFRFPPYIAGLVVSEDPAAAGFEDGAAFIRALFHPLRPYGGVIWLKLDNHEHSFFAASVRAAELEQAVPARGEGFVMLTRPGPLPGAGSWTHQYADAGNTAYSADARVKAPLGIAWFGGEPNHKTLPRHMFGPNPKVLGGRLFLLGPHHVSARCVYTGIELWAQELPEVGASFTDYEYEERPAPAYFPSHPGANFIGSPLVVSEDAVYVLHQDQCLALDVATGRRLKVFQLPDLEKAVGRPHQRSFSASYGAHLQEGERRQWGHLRVAGDYLIVAAYPHMFDDRLPGRENTWNATSSEFIAVLDRHRGELRWAHQARYGFRHNAIVAGNDKIFVIDHLSETILRQLRRRGIEPQARPRIQALNIHTGELEWTFEEDVFGTALAYSEEHDVLVQSGHRRPRNPLPDEPRDRITAIRGLTGEKLWAEAHRQRRAPLGLHAGRGEVIGSIGEGAFEMISGERRRHINPVTGREEDWQWLGALRCGTQNFSQHLITFRSGAAGFTDLPGKAKTGNIPGFRPGCTNNLVVADGLLNAPEYTRSCSCSYQLQTSLGLVHLAEAEMWTFSPFSRPDRAAVERVGINFAAPGGRLDQVSGVSWFEYPALVEPGLRVAVEIDNEDEVSWFRHHSSWITDSGSEGHSWVASYGVEGAENITVELVDGAAGRGECYQVTLYFAEPEPLAAGERVFDVFLQGHKVLDRFDVVREAGGPRRVVRADFDAVPVDRDLEISLSPHPDSRPAILSGVEVRKEIR